MGIRFLCPNGHKLNVKAYLAGERGICPQCDAKFLVPQESGGQVAALIETTEPAPVVASTPAVEVSTQTVTPPPPPPTESAAAPAAEVPAPEAWYVRTAAGEQYGPANIEVMQQWVTEGRVTVDCWVWKTGWPEWKAGGHAITLLNGPVPELPQASVQPTDLPAESVPAAAEQLPADALPQPAPNATTLYRTSKRIRQERARKVTFFLGGLVLLLTVVLIVVLVNNS